MCSPIFSFSFEEDSSHIVPSASPAKSPLAESIGTIRSDNLPKEVKEVKAPIPMPWQPTTRTTPKKPETSWDFELLLLDARLNPSSPVTPTRSFLTEELRKQAGGANSPENKIPEASQASSSFSSPLRRTKKVFDFREFD